MQEIWERYHQFIGFVVAIIVCLVINLIALTCTNHAYKDGQQRILQSYKESLSMIDSLQKQNEDALNRVLAEREKTIKKILSDTLIDSIQGLCTKQKDAVRKYGGVGVAEKEIASFSVPEKVRLLRYSFVMLILFSNFAASNPGMLCLEEKCSDYKVSDGV